jgi:hypothetical protein
MQTLPKGPDSRFHGDNTGSNPVGDANKINYLASYPSASGTSSGPVFYLLHYPFLPATACVAPCLPFGAAFLTASTRRSLPRSASARGVWLIEVLKRCLNLKDTTFPGKG